MRGAEGEDSRKNRGCGGEKACGLTAKTRWSAFLTDEGEDLCADFNQLRRRLRAFAPDSRGVPIQAFHPIGESRGR